MRSVRAYYCDKISEGFDFTNARIAEIRDFGEQQYRVVTYFPLAKKGTITHAHHKGYDAFHQSKKFLEDFAEKQGYSLIPIED
jgi:hypothetical protein